MLIGELSAEQRQRLLVIANLCPVHKSLTSGIDVQTDLADQVAVMNNSSET